LAVIRMLNLHEGSRRNFFIAYLMCIAFFFTIVPWYTYSENRPSAESLRSMTPDIMEDITGLRLREADDKISLLEEEAPGSYYTAFVVAYRQYLHCFLYPYLEEVNNDLEFAAERTIILCKGEGIHNNRVDATIFHSCSQFFIAMLRYRQKRHFASLVRLEMGMHTYFPYKC
jgi:hypothetical protein